jgi:hypothetical protein
VVNYEHVLVAARPWYLRRWWLRIRACESILLNGLWTAQAEFYVPWWSWPLELIHRFFFGKVTLYEKSVKK